MKINLKYNKSLKASLILGLLFSVFIPLQLQAQLQSFDFSGNNPESYQCFDSSGKTYLNGEVGPGGVTVDIYKDNTTGYYLCGGRITNQDGTSSLAFDNDADGKADRAILRPPALQQIEIWFVRILYVIWAVVAGFSFFLLVAVGYQYILRGGTSDQELVKLRKRIINFAIGFALVFLAVPILNTVFRLLGVNTDVDCYNVNMPGFQFFFTNVCTGNETLLLNACKTGSGISDGLACSPPGSYIYCSVNDQNEVVLSTTDTNDSNTMFFICATGAGSVDRSVWVQYVP